MKALPSRLIRATVTTVDLDDPFNVVVWVRPEGAADDAPSIRVGFQRFGEHVDKAALERVSGSEVGDLVEVGYTQMPREGADATFNLGRSFIKTDGE